MRRLLLFLLALTFLAACYEGLGRRPVAEDDDDAADDDDDSAGDDDDDDATDDDDDDDDDATDDDDTQDLECEVEGETDCWGTSFVECDESLWTLVEECVEPTPFCDVSLGCLACQPSTRTCDGDTVVECLPDGSGSSVVEECDPGAICVAGECLDQCDLAEQQMSYLGCEFMAVSTANIVGPEFDSDFAVVIGVPAGGQDADVQVSKGGVVVTTQTIAAGETSAITLAYDATLKNAQESVTVTGGAYEITSTVPVAAYQYNPLHFDIGGTPSYTNDASLLLPEHTLSGNYMVSTWPTWGRGEWQEIFTIVTGEWDSWYPGFVTVAATVDGTVVTFDSSTQTAGGNPGALSPGGTTNITLDRGDVVQIFSHRPGDEEDQDYCSDQGWDATMINCPPAFLQECEGYCSVTGGDLTGSTVTATEPVAVFAGHMCTFMPYYEWACDHLEEMMFPVETWGTTSVMSAPVHPSSSGVAPTLYRIVAENSGTTLTFEPSVNPSVTLSAGEFVQFQTDQDFKVEGTDRFYVTQTMLGETALGEGGGAPAMGSGIPWLQVRSEYDFLTPTTYTANYVNVVAPTGTAVDLDGSPVSGWTAIGSTGFDVARVSLSAGSHHIESASGTGFGITTYGYASFTSYLYPGGLNFTR